MAKYGEKATESVERTMRKRKKGTLRSGSGQKVKSREQAIAIGLSEARKKGAKVPRKKAAGSRSKSGSKSGSASKSGNASKSRSSSGGKSSSRKSSSRKSSSRSKSS